MHAFALDHRFLRCPQTIEGLRELAIVLQRDLLGLLTFGNLALESGVGGLERSRRSCTRSSSSSWARLSWRCTPFALHRVLHRANEQSGDPHDL
jgi:hypothetical protein